jgi:hypothetical protein
MATLPDVHRVPKLRVLRVVLLALAVGVLLSWAATPSLPQPADQPATPVNQATEAHPWGTPGCSIPGAAIDAVPGVFDFQHACIHHGGCYEGLDRQGDPAVIDRLHCDTLFRADLVASCVALHGTSTGWRAKECESTAQAYYAVVRSFGATYYTGSGNPA